MPPWRAGRAEAEALRRQWVTRAETAAAVGWLERRPRLGFDVFARGRPEAARAGCGAGMGEGPGSHDTGEGLDADPDAMAGGMETETPVAGGDITDLLRACLVALRLPPDADAYQPGRRSFWSVGAAAARITRLLAGLPDGADLEAFVPEIAKAGPSRALHRRVAVMATLLAGLELARDGALTLRQDISWQAIQLRHRDHTSPDGAAEPATGLPEPVLA